MKNKNLKAQYILGRSQPYMPKRILFFILGSGMITGLLCGFITYILL